MALRGFEKRWAETIGRTIAPRGVLGGVTDEVDLGGLFSEEHRDSPWQAAFLLRLSLWITWLAPPFVMGRFHTFGGLAEADRERLLDKLLDSPRYYVRLAALFLKLETTTLLLGNQRTFEQLGAYGMGEAGARDRAEVLSGPPRVKQPAGGVR